MLLAFYWIVTVVINYIFLSSLAESTHCLNNLIRCLHRQGDNFLNYVIVPLLPNLQSDFALRRNYHKIEIKLT